VLSYQPRRGPPAPLRGPPARPAPLIVSTGLFVGPVLSRARRARRPCSTTSGPTSPRPRRGAPCSTCSTYARCGPRSTRPYARGLVDSPTTSPTAPYARRGPGRRPCSTTCSTSTSTPDSTPDSPVRPGTPVVGPVLDVIQPFYARSNLVASPTSPKPGPFDLTRPGMDKHRAATSGRQPARRSRGAKSRGNF